MNTTIQFPQSISTTPTTTPPPPAPAAPVELYTAPLFKRVLGGLIDWIALVLATCVGSALHLSLLGALALGLVQTALLTTNSQTLGKMAVGTRIVRLDGTPAGFVWGGLVRNQAPNLALIVTVFLASIVATLAGVALEDLDFLALAIGVVYSVVDVIFLLGDEHRRIADHIAGTRVVEIATTLPDLDAL